MKKLILLAVSIVLLITSCKKNEDPVANVSKCKITEVVTIGQGDITGADPSSYTYTQKFDYNDKNLLSGSSSQQSGKTKSNKTATYSASSSNQYDADGYLIRQVYQSSSTDINSKSNSYSYNKSYEYTANRLTKEITASSSTNEMGKTTTRTATATYEYTADGKVSKYAYSSSSSDGTSDNSFTTYEYSSGILSKLSYSRGGVTTAPFIEVNSQGLLTKHINGLDEIRYQYDTEGNRTLEERWYSGKKKDARVYEYDTKQNVNLLLYSPFKGHPDLNFYIGKDYLATHNLTKDSRIVVDGAGVEKPSGNSSYTFQYNSNNLPTSSGTTYTGSDGKVSQQSTVGYTYKDCQ